MAYTPPAGNAVDFNFTVSSYTPPAGNATDFSFIASMIGDIDISLTMEGTILEPADLRGNINMSLTMTGALSSRVNATSMFMIF